MWGIRKICWAIRLQQRITPTCVGNTQLFVEYLGTVQDHPHMCGEYFIKKPSFRIQWGSPPHVWGIQLIQALCDLIERITPTRVGNTFLNVFSLHECQDHPHTCGEYANDCNRIITDTGSPPHVWGILYEHADTDALHRITPTRVGNTTQCLVIIPLWQDHPHTCGEYRLRPLRNVNSFGSPPHVWGIH